MRLQSYACCFAEDDIWFVDFYYSYLFRYIGSTGRCEAVCRLPDNNKAGVPYTEVVFCSKSIICIPGSSEHIAIYDLDRKHLTSIPILPLIQKENIRKIASFGAFDLAVEFENKIIMFGNCCECVLILDVQSGNVEIKKDLHNTLREDKQDITCLFRKDIAVKNEYAYLASYVDNKVIEYNLRDYSFKIFEIERECKGYIGICSNGEEFWLLEKKGKLLQWDNNINKVRQVIDIPDFEQETGGRFFGAKDNIYILRQMNKKYYIYSMVNQEMEERENEGTDIQNLDICRYPFAHQYRDNFYIFNIEQRKINVYDSKFTLTNEIVLNISVGYIRERWEGCVVENEEMTIEDLMIYIVNNIFEQKEKC